MEDRTEKKKFLFGCGLFALSAITIIFFNAQDTFFVCLFNFYNANTARKLLQLSRQELRMGELTHNKIVCVSDWGGTCFTKRKKVIRNKSTRWYVFCACVIKRPLDHNFFFSPFPLCFTNHPRETPLVPLTQLWCTRCSLPLHLLLAAVVDVVNTS